MQKKSNRQTYQLCQKLSENLKNLMKAINITQKELGEKTGIAQSNINRILSQSDFNPTIWTVKKIAAFFSISVSDLIGDELPTTLIEQKKGASDNFCKIPLIDIERAYEFTQEGRNKAITEDFYIQRIPTYRSFAIRLKKPLNSLKLPEGTIMVIESKCVLETGDIILITHTKQKISSLARAATVDGVNEPLKIDLETGEIQKLTRNEHIIHGIVATTTYGSF